MIRRTQKILLGILAEMNFALYLTLAALALAAIFFYLF